jgi:hypothetical protein
MANNKWLGESLKNIMQDPLYAGKTVVKNALPKKMSTVLLDFAKPLLDDVVYDNYAIESAIQLAIIVWNYLIISSDKYPSKLADIPLKKMLEKTITIAFSDEIGKKVFAHLMNRKKSLYAENSNLIADFNIIWEDNRNIFHLTVITHG